MKMPSLTFGGQEGKCEFHQENLHENVFGGPRLEEEYSKLSLSKLELQRSIIQLCMRNAPISAGMNLLTMEARTLFKLTTHDH